MSADSRTTVHECWNDIGRPGPGTCPELAQHIVCRNCPTYASAALRLLDRPAPADYLRDWTAHIANTARVAPKATRSALVFRLGQEWLGLSTDVVEQIIEPSRVHSLPHRGLPLCGVVTVRGELVVCVALDSLLGLGASRAAATSTAAAARRLVVLSADGNRVAFEPDEVLGVERYDPQELVAPPSTLAKRAGTHFTTGLSRMGGRTVGCLDADSLFAALNRILS